MARGVDFGKPRFTNSRPFRACLYTSIRQRFRTVHATGYRLGNLRKGLELH